MSDQSRRRVLQLGGTALLSGLAGCSGVTDRFTGGSAEDNDTTTPTEDKPEQQYTLPPITELGCEGERIEHPDAGEVWVYGIPNEDGNVLINAVFESTTTSGDPHLYFEDEITYELFVYTTFPVGNDISLTKVLEKTNAPYRQAVESFEVPYEDLPKDQQIRFRLKVTNTVTGDSEWAMDQRVVSYPQFGEDITTAASKNGYSVFKGPEDWNLNRFETSLKDGSYVMNYKVSQAIPSQELPEEVPFSREAYKLENDLYRNDDEPRSVSYSTRQIEMPESHVELSNELMDRGNVESYYNDFTFSFNVPSEYDYYGRNQYDVLNSPIYTQMANGIHQAQSSYGVENHFAKIETAMKMIQTNEYAAVTGSIRDVPIHLPEAYWADPAENCVGMSFQLCWFLYHLGYTCGTVWLDRSGGNASHLGVGMPVPAEVIESDFPDGYLSTLENPDVPTIPFIEQITEIFGPGSRPETLGEHPWVYLEATQPITLGVIPFEPDTIENRRVRFAIEPEDNVFGTDIGAPNTR